MTPTVAHPRQLMLCVVLLAGTANRIAKAQTSVSCLDGFCIGQSIQDHRFEEVQWLLPKIASKDHCNAIGCQPQNAFRGYSADIQSRLALAVSWSYGLRGQTPLFKESIPTLRLYRYECNQLVGQPPGERRFVGIYRSTPSGYVTAVGLRLINGELKVYRIAREYPFHNQGELTELAKELMPQYGNEILFYNYLSSNAYSEVIEKKMNGWFARSSLFNPNDSSDNTAELVLVDPKTRSLLEPSSMPESGEISAIPAKIPAVCSRPMPLQ